MVINTAVLIALGLGLLVLVLLAAGAWLLNRLRAEQAELQARVASLEATGSETPAQPVIPLLDQAPRRAGQQVTTLTIGEPAPDATFLDISGKTGSLAEFRGRDTTIVFWDGTSEACRQILSGLQAVEGRPRLALPGLLLVVPGSSSGNQVVKLRSPLVLDRDGSFARAFGVDTWPSAVMVDARGEIVSQLVSGPDRVLALANGSLPHARGLVRWAGLDFEVSRDTLTPRPETESLAEKAVELARKRGVRTVADIGTGSGVIATFLARELPGAHIYAVDASSEALAVAQRNLESHQVADRVTLLEGSLLEPVPEQPDLITTNIPYLSDEMMASAGSRLLFESPRALHGGSTGLELYRQLFGQLVERGWSVPLVLEIYPSQAEDMRELLHTTLGSGNVEILPAYRGWARVVVFLPDGLSDAGKATAAAPVTADNAVSARATGPSEPERRRG